MERPAGAEEKAWGWALTLWEQKYTKADGTLAVQCRGVRVFIRAGGYSSIHKHRQCSNIFSVTKGKLRLRDFIASDYADVAPVFSAQSTLEEGDHPLTFPPECLHQFEALTDVLALEVYIAGPDGDASAADIVRFSENGCKQQPKLYGLDYKISPDMPNAKVAFGSMERYAHVPYTIVPESVRVDEDGSITATVTKEDGDVLRKAFADETNVQDSPQAGSG